MQLLEPRSWHESISLMTAASALPAQSDKVFIAFSKVIWSSQIIPKCLMPSVCSNWKIPLKLMFWVLPLIWDLFLPRSYICQYSTILHVLLNTLSRPFSVSVSSARVRKISQSNGETCSCHFQHWWQSLQLRAWPPPQLLHHWHTCMQQGFIERFNRIDLYYRVS